MHSLYSRVRDICRHSHRAPASPTLSPPPHSPHHNTNISHAPVCTVFISSVALLAASSPSRTDCSSRAGSHQPPLAAECGQGFHVVCADKVTSLSSASVHGRPSSCVGQLTTDACHDQSAARKLDSVLECRSDSALGSALSFGSKFLHKQHVELDQWSCDNVNAWLSAVNMFELSHVFKQHSIDGSGLVDLTNERLSKMGITDSHVQSMLLLCVRRLQRESDVSSGVSSGYSTCTQEAGTCSRKSPVRACVLSTAGGGHEEARREDNPSLAPTTQPEEAGVAPSTERCDFCPLDGDSRHRLCVNSFYGQLVRCHVCRDFLLGLEHQGLICTVCGLILHRQCARLIVPLPVCCGAPCSQPAAATRPPAFSGAPPGGTAAHVHITCSAQLVQMRTCPSTGAPLVLLHLLEALERRVSASQPTQLVCETRAGSASIDARAASPLCVYDDTTHAIKSDDLRAISHLFSTDYENIALDCYNITYIATIIKRFLLQLTNPVWPIEYYEQLITIVKRHADSSRNGGSTTHELRELVTQLPGVHTATLRCVIRHMYQLFHAGAQTATDERCLIDSMRQMCCALSLVLIRPPYDQLTCWPERTEQHALALWLLLTGDFDWGTPLAQHFVLVYRRTCETTSATAPTPTRPVAQTTSAAAHQSALVSLSSQSWYWGHISREQVAEMMAGQCDGTFLVRDASSGVPGEYTLTLRHLAVNRLIRIYCRDTRYGFSEQSCCFVSVPALIAHYRTHSLVEYNAQLDVCLQRPLCEVRQDEAVDTEALVERVNALSQQTVSVAERCALAERVRQETGARLRNKTQALHAFRQVLYMLQEQERCYQATVKSEQLSASDVALMEQSWNLIQARAQALLATIERHETEVNTLSAQQHACDLSVREARSVRRTCEQRLQCLERELSRRQLVTSQQPQEEVAAAATFSSDRWLMLDGCDRARAVQMLSGRADGTFLVRRSAHSDSVHALSVVALGRVQHCCVVRTPSGRYGFTESSAAHASLQDFVDYYSRHQLLQHNELLPIRLTYPVLGPAEHHTAQ